MTTFWSRYDIAWAAGIVEGEGCVSVMPQLRQVRVQVDMADEDVVRRLHETFGIGTVSQQVRANRKVLYRWNINNRIEVARFLGALAPRMGLRRRQKFLEAAELIGALGPKHVRQPAWRKSGR